MRGLGRLGGASYRQAVLNDVPVGYWPLDEGVVTAVASWDANKDVLASTSSRLQTTSEKFTLADSADISTGDVDFAFCGWVWFTDGYGGSMFTKYDDGDGDREYVVGRQSVHPHNTGGYTANRIYFELWDGTDRVGLVEANSLGATVVETWYFINAWHDASESKSYISVNNGTTDSATLTGNVADTGTALQVGHDVAGTANYQMAGRTARYGWWKRILTAAERTYLYNAGSSRAYSDIGTAATDGSALKTNLVSWWNFDEASGNAIDAHASNDLTDVNTVGTADGPGGGPAVDGNAVSQQDDQSGHANNATQATGANKPTLQTAELNSLPILRFDGTNDSLATGSNASLDDIWSGGGTLAIVFNPDSDGGGDLGRLLSKTNWELQTMEESGGNVRVQFVVDWSTDGKWETPVNVPIGSHSIVLITYDSASASNNATIRVNGTADSTTDTSAVGTFASDASATLYIGNIADGSRGFDGDIAEVVLFDRTLDAADIDIVEGSLAHKFGLEGNLPAAHTYKSVDPGPVLLSDGIAIDHSGNSNGGVYQNGTAIAEPALAKGGLRSAQFDSVNDLVSVADATEIQNVFASGGSIEAWFDADSDGGGNLGCILDKTEWQLATGEESGGDVRLVFTSNRSTDGIWKSPVDIAINQKHHVIVTYNSSATGNDPAIYVDGKEVGSEAQEPSGAQATDAGDDLYIGNRSDGARGFDGHLGGIAVYDRVLTSDQVRRHYYAGRMA